jgi:thiamine transporter ThiT
MEGAMDFRTALASRLSAMQITREKLDEFITQHVRRFGWHARRGVVFFVDFAFLSARH